MFGLRRVAALAVDTIDDQEDEDHDERTQHHTDDIGVSVRLSVEGGGREGGER